VLSDQQGDVAIPAGGRENVDPARVGCFGRKSFGVNPAVADLLGSGALRLVQARLVCFRVVGCGSDRLGTGRRASLIGQEGCNGRDGEIVRRASLFGRLLEGRPALISRVTLLLAITLHVSAY